MARLVHRRTGSVVNVSDDKAAEALRDLGFVAESDSKATKKAPAKKAAAKKSSK